MVDITQGVLEQRGERGGDSSERLLFAVIGGGNPFDMFEDP